MRRPAISQWSSDKIGIGTYDSDVLTDPENEDVSLDIIRKDTGVLVVNDASATRDDEGLYSFSLTSAHTSTQGDYRVIWSYQMNGQAVAFEDEFTINGQQPYWDSLTSGERQVVENVYHRVSDTYDSKEGGPYLWELPQSAFGFETIARLMVTEALPYINLSPPKAFVPGFQVGKESTKAFPEGWYGLLEKAAEWSLYKHLSRSYIEQPVPQGAQFNRLDRKDYRDQWRREADSTKLELDQMLKMLKRQWYYSTYRALLVAGGMFPMSYLNPARPQYPYLPARMM